MPSTFTHGIVPGTCLALTGKTSKIPRGQLARLFLIGFFLGNGPDLDVIPGSIWANHFGDIHRNWGHNIFSILALTWFGTFLFNRFIDAEWRPKRVWLVSFLLLFSHVIFDSLGEAAADGIRHGVPLFWPLSDWQLLSPFTVFFSYSVQKDLNPLLGHLLSVQFWTRAVFSEIAFTATCITLWLGGNWFLRKIKRRAEKATEEELPSHAA